MKNTNLFQLSAIAAMDEHQVIGDRNQLPWHLPADLRHFKALTTGNVILMGRKTHAAIGKPLPNRVNIIISRDSTYDAPGCLKSPTIDGALALAAAQGTPIFIIGGAEIYRQTLPLISRLYLTIIHHTFEGDAFFPALEENVWETIDTESHEKDAENPYDFTFMTLARKA